MKLRFLVAFWLAAVSACSRPRPVDTSGFVTFLTPAMQGGESILGPAGDFFTARFLVFLPLVRRDESGGMEGVLAKTWEHDSEAGAWTVHLRTDVYWHDGIPVTAGDVDFTLRLLSHPEILWLSPDDFSLRVLDDSTYTIRTRSPLAPGTPLNDWIVFFPGHLLAELDPSEFAEWEFWLKPVGDGPYRHVRTVPSTLVELEANHRYYLGPPSIERIRLKLGGQATLELLSGEVDGAPWLPWPEASRLANDPRFEVHYAFDPHQVVALYWNHRHPALADPAVRRALTLAIDRRRLIQLLDLPTATPVFDVPPASELEFPYPEGPAAERNRQPLGFDPDAARDLLERAGWRAADGGVRRRGGAELTMTLLSFDDRTERIGVFVQEQLRQVGARLSVLHLDGDVVLDRMRAGEFDVAVHAFLTHFASEDVQGILRLYGPESPIGYHNPRVTALLERAAQTIDPEVISGIYRDLAPILEADMPVTVLHPIVWNWVVRARVRGLLNRRRLYDPLWASDGIWIEDASPQTKGK